MANRKNEIQRMALDVAALPPSIKLTMNTEDGHASLSVLVNQIDHILTPPGPLNNAVSVIHIYGASSTGEKACVHVHQVSVFLRRISFKRDPRPR
ncbi:hypothetical protein OG21DRAFT_1511231 [Imleria badia]|nr:hypothetical protein OG21DRAFT_1511231 [Imleria badia]